MAPQNTKPHNRRPVFLNLLQIHFPVTAIISILHRISGVVLVLFIPFALYLLSMALTNEAGFAQASAIMRQPLTKIMSVLAVWALAHHLCAGIRYLCIDLDFGLDKTSARVSAYAASITAIVITLVYTGSLL